MGGTIVVAQMGDPNASIPTPQPVYSRPMFGSFGQSLTQSSVSFVSQAAEANGVKDQLGLAKKCRRRARHPYHRQIRHASERCDASRLRCTPKPTKSALTASCSPANLRKSCQWRSAISCSEVAMTDIPLAQILHRSGHWSGEAAACSLDYAARFLRRKRLTTDAGQAFVVDLAQTTSLNDGDALELADGGRDQGCRGDRGVAYGHRCRPPPTCLAHRQPPHALPD